MARLQIDMISGVGIGAAPVSAFDSHIDGLALANVAGRIQHAEVKLHPNITRAKLAERHARVDCRCAADLDIAIADIYIKNGYLMPSPIQVAPPIDKGARAREV